MNWSKDTSADVFNGSSDFGYEMCKTQTLCSSLNGYNNIWVSVKHLNAKAMKSSSCRYIFIHYSEHSIKLLFSSHRHWSGLCCVVDEPFSSHTVTGTACLKRHTHRSDIMACWEEHSELPHSSDQYSASFNLFAHSLLHL